jgi:hypothetical protein
MPMPMPAFRSAVGSLHSAWTGLTWAREEKSLMILVFVLLLLKKNICGG